MIPVHWILLVLPAFVAIGCCQQAPVSANGNLAGSLMKQQWKSALDTICQSEILDQPAGFAFAYKSLECMVKVYVSTFGPSSARINKSNNSPKK